VLIYAHMQLG